MKKLLLCVGVLFLILACDSKDDNDCSLVSCPEPTLTLAFEIVDATSEENLFAKDTFLEEDISVTNQSDESDVEVNLISENDLDILQIGFIGLETATADYIIEIGEEISFRLMIDAERVTGDCCTTTKLNSLQIDGAEIETNGNSGLFRILVELPNE